MIQDRSNSKKIREITLFGKIASVRDGTEKVLKHLNVTTEMDCRESKTIQNTCLLCPF